MYFMTSLIATSMPQACNFGYHTYLSIADYITLGIPFHEVGISGSFMYQSCDLEAHSVLGRDLRVPYCPALPCLAGLTQSSQDLIGNKTKTTYSYTSAQDNNRKHHYSVLSPTFFRVSLEITSFAFNAKRYSSPKTIEDQKSDKFAPQPLHLIHPTNSPPISVELPFTDRRIREHQRLRDPVDLHTFDRLLQSARCLPSLKLPTMASGRSSPQTSQQALSKSYTSRPSGPYQYVPS